MSEAPSSMVDRVVLILSVFERSSEALTAGQVSVRSGIPRSSVQRILQQLGQRPLAEASRRRVRTRPAHVRNRQPGHAPQPDHVGRAADHPRTAGTDRPRGPPRRPRPAGCRLPGQGWRCLRPCLADTLPSRVGGRFPAHCTAVGKALLAYSPQATVTEYLATGLRRRTLASLATPAALEAAIAAIRGAGYADRTGRSRARGRVRRRPDPQLRRGCRRGSVCGPRDQVRAKELRPLVMWTAAEISRSLMTARFPARPGRLAGPRLRARPPPWPCAGRRCSRTPSCWRCSPRLPGTCARRRRPPCCRPRTARGSAGCRGRARGRARPQTTPPIVPTSPG